MLASKPLTAAKSTPLTSQVHALLPVWNAITPAELELAQSISRAGETQTRLLVAAADEAQWSAIKTQYPQSDYLPLSATATTEQLLAQLVEHDFEHLVWVTPASTFPGSGEEDWGSSNVIAAAQQKGVLCLFRLLKALLQAGYDEKQLEWTLLTFRTQAVTQQEETDPTHAAIHGLAGSLSKEYPHWTIRLLDLDSDDVSHWPLQTLWQLPARERWALAYRRLSADSHQREGEWFRQELIRVHPLAATAVKPVYRQQGVYIVIGGAGGIGEVWSHYMMEHYQAKIVWVGRRQKDQTIQQQLDALPAPADAMYIRADACDPTQLCAVRDQVKKRFQHIHGVLHSAIVLNDLSLARMDEAGFSSSLAVKVDISVNLVRVFRKEALDLVLFFSSMQAFARAPGQSNYAAGCTFKDAFALRLAQQWPYSYSNGSSHHKPLVKVINWGYWGSIGIVNDATYRGRREEAGDGSIEPQEGMDILQKFVTSPFSQLAPFKALKAEVVSEACGLADITAYSSPVAAVLEKTQQRFVRVRDQLPHVSVATQEQLATESQNPAMDLLLAELLEATLSSLALRTGERTLTGYLQRWLTESQRLLNDGKSQLKPALQATRPLAQVWQDWDRAKTAWMGNDNLKASVILVETCIRALPAILQNKRSATDVMFPNGSMELVEGIYRGNVVSDYFQQALADFLVLAIQQRLDAAAANGETVKIRILEIGAGTGGTTATILPCLKPFAGVIEEYCYTDLSKAFLLHAQEHYAPGNPFLTTQIFNVELPLSEQAGETQPVKANDYDFVIAANVLHATKNIRQTLRNAKAALHNNGVLLLNELSHHTLLSHLTFGLLEGWWLYEDAPLRILGSPGLYPETWSALLVDEGFSPVALPVQDSRAFGLQIIAAQSDGIVQQTRPALDFNSGDAAAVLPTEFSAEAAKEPILTPAAPDAGGANRADETPVADFSEEELREKSADYLRQRIAAVLKMNPVELDMTKPLEVYGIDSIMVVQLANDLRQVFKKVSNTLFFEVQTIDALVSHFLTTQRDTLIDVLGLDVKVPAELITSKPGLDRLTRQPGDHHLHSQPAAAKDNSRQHRVRDHAGVFDVAVIGLSGRYPQAEDIDAFWQQLSTGNNCISEIPASRWDWQAYFDPQKGKAGKSYTRWGGFLTNADCFDPWFFRISPREAEAMDPQERLFLQGAYEALQDAGYTPRNFGQARRTGVFVGVMNSSYRGKPAYFSVANRVSYQFDFHGPSMAVDTACSASLTALHVALESMYCGSSEQAVVGGVNLILNPGHYTSLTELGMLSSGAECKSFGSGADGFIAAEGVGAIIIKPLSAALEDNDHIYGVLKGSAVNAGGKTNGYTVPNPVAQTELVQTALQRAGVSSEEVDYIEAHGTGTALGDPIEIKGLSDAFQAASVNGGMEAGRCIIGSVKSNIGHCESAAGIAGLTKVLLQFKHRQWVPSLHSRALNPDIDFEETPFVVQQQLSDWELAPAHNADTDTALPKAKIAGISSFGAGGANAHVILQEYLPQTVRRSPAAVTSTDPVLILLSAKDHGRLCDTATRLLRFVRDTAVDESLYGFNLANLAYTLQLGREALESRLGFIAGSMAEVEDKLLAFLSVGEGDNKASVVEFYQSPDKPDSHAVNVLRSDEDMTTLLASWLAKRKYTKLLDLWVLGAEIDWQQLYDTAALTHLRRISLPTYPFLQERYWYDSSVSVPAPVATAEAAATTNNTASPVGNKPVQAAPADSAHNDVLPDAPGISFVAQWEAQMPLTPSVSALSRQHQQVLLVCSGPESALERAIVARYTGTQLTIIRLGDANHRINANEWLCDRRDAAGLAYCLRDILAIDCVYFLPQSVSSPGTAAVTDNLLVEAEQHEIQLLRLAKHLLAVNNTAKSQAKSPDPIDLYILTVDSYALGQDSANPVGAGLTGMAYAIAQGMSDFAVRNIDLSAADVFAVGQHQSLVAAIMQEPAANRGEVVKLRAEQRYRQVFRDLNWPVDGLSVIRQRGVYLLLGGSGTIGQVITRQLISRYQARVVWLGRSPVSAAKIQAALAACTVAGISPLYFEADATRADQLQQAIARIKQQQGAIHGAIYSALVFDAENTVEHTTEQQFRDILEVKTRGSLNFYRALSAESMDFMCYFSSGQAYAFSGAARHAAYASGITFSDALVRALNTQADFPVGSINWGFWRASLTADAAQQSFGCLDDAEGFECFEKFVFALQQQKLTQALCLKPSASVLALMNYQSMRAAPGNSYTAPQSAANTVAANPANNRALSSVDVAGYILEVTTDCFAQTLKAPREKIDSALAFAEYGLDSILGVRFVNQLNERLQIALNTAIIFEYASLTRLSEHIHQHYGEHIARQQVANHDVVLAEVCAADSAHITDGAAIALVPTVAQGAVVQQTPPFRAASGDIAVIGMAGQFPGADSPEELWANLINAVDGVTEYPAEYLDQTSYYSTEKQAGKSYCKRGGILTKRHHFDPQFFNLSPREAHAMNPHQRLVMQEGWKALEDAGYDPTGLAGSRTSVFIGAEPTGYANGSFTGASDALVASRLSYHLNLTGPALVVNTGCSSSSVAIHLACESLRNGESDLAIAGGVNACMNQEALLNLSAADMLSAEGVCRTFDAEADGTIISEGIGIVVLKRLEDAVAAGDTIDGVICASGTNQDGASNGITAPNGTAQEQLIRDVYQRFGIDPAKISYVEAHGTGTRLGDPVEANALIRAFRTLTDRQSYCAVGSAKSHIGHTSAAAGVIGLIKTLLSLKHQQLPALLNFQQLNPMIEFAGSPFYINTTNTGWSAQDEMPRMAAINSFGHSGTNAHIVIREHLSTPATMYQEQVKRASIQPVLIPFSARNEQRLQVLLKQHLDFLETSALAQTITLDDIAYTLQTGREAMRHRFIVAVNTPAELQQCLRAYLNNEPLHHSWQGVVDKNNAPSARLSVSAFSEPSQLAYAWCQGSSIDWSALYSSQRTMRRVHLPTYPFADKAYGIQQNPVVGNGVVPPATSRQQQLKAQLHAQRAELQNADMEKLLFDLLWVSLHETGLLAGGSGTEQQVGGEVVVSPIATAAMAQGKGYQVPAFYQRWLDESIQSLLERGYLQQQNGKFYATRSVSLASAALWQVWDQEKIAWLGNANQRAQINLVEACVRYLPQILTGKKLATEVMFPNGSLELVEGIYQNNLISDYFNQVLADTLIAAIKERLQREPQARLRILEIGAGTGGTTRGLLPQLKPFQAALEDYCYTDLSKAFLNHAKLHYAPGNDYLSTRILNVDQPLGEQGIPTQHFDFVIATNVLHATGNIRRTVKHAHSALRPGGLMLLNEMSDKSLFVHLTFGLLEGWWLYDDTELRIPGIPGLSPDSWSAVLQQTGFTAVNFPVRTEHIFGQQIILAENAQVDVGNSVNLTPATLTLAVTSEQAQAAAPVNIEDYLCEVLTTELAEALQMEAAEVVPDESFADYGLDSLLGINFIRTVNQRLQIDLETVVIFDYNSVLKLGRHIAVEFGDAINQAGLMPVSDQTPVTAQQRAPSLVQSVVPDPQRSAPQAISSPENETIANNTPAREGGSAAFIQEPIAIVGMDGQFAQSSNLDELWENLAAGRDLVRPAARWDLSNYFSSDTLKNPDFCTDGGFMDDIDRFDPLFFKISGAEATYMDPQQRLFLQAAWSALEDAGYATDDVSGKPYGVFLGYGGTDYKHLFEFDTAPAQAFWGNSASIIPARIAYYLDITGPAVTVDTACSGSLVAIHQACQNLWTKEIDLALAGGVSVMCTPAFYQTGTDAGMLSSSGRCQSFDARADGFIPGEGVGVVALKRLSSALADGDHIHGVIRGTAMNQDGNTNGITAPSARSQEQLEKCVYDRFQIDPAGIQLVEAHGTGTKLGDPIEVSALTRSFRAHTDKTAYCALGSVKSNIGHAGPVAGVAGLFKILLGMRHKKIPASLHFETPNPEIRFQDSPFYVNSVLQDWEVVDGDCRRAAVSSFGFSGTNAHMVIEEPPRHPLQQHAVRPLWFIALSARTAEQLAQKAQDLLSFCTRSNEQEVPVEVGNLSYTLLLKRKHWQHRLTCLVGSVTELEERLTQWLNTGKSPQVHVTCVAEGMRETKSLARYGRDCLATCLNLQNAGDYSAVYRESLEALSELYNQGYRLDWKLLFPTGFSTLSLPTYPFARERYWVETTEPVAEEQVQQVLSSASGNPLPNQVPGGERDAAVVRTTLTPPDTQLLTDISGTADTGWMFVREDWHDCPLPETDWQQRLKGFAGKAVWIICGDEQERQRFSGLLEQLQQSADITEPLQINWFNRYDLQLNRRTPIPELVLMLGGDMADYPGVDVADPTGLSAVKAAYQVSQFLMQRAWEEPVQLYFLYESTLSAPRLDCEALPGLFGTAMMENPNHSWTLIGHYEPQPALSSLQILLREWLATAENASAQQQTEYQRSAQAQIFRSHTFPRISYVESKRRVNRRMQCRFDHKVGAAFQKNKTYLLVGGLGLVGEELCAELAERYQSTLVILSKSECDAGRQQQCQRLEALGAVVHYHTVDVTDYSALQHIYTNIKQQVGDIHGVIHLANTVEGGLVAGVSQEAFLDMGRVKTQGTLYLDKLTAAEPLDFFMLFSSIVAFGIRGSAGYSYACAFLNAFAEYRNRLRESGQRTGNSVSLCWGPWTSDPVHAGKDPQRKQKIHADGFGLITIKSVLPLLERSSGQALPMLGIWSVHDAVRAAQFMGVEPRQDQCSPDAGTGSSVERVGLQPTTPAPPATKTEAAQREDEQVIRWEHSITAWEQQLRSGQTVSTETIAEAIDLSLMSELKPVLIERVHRLLFPPADVPEASDTVPTDLLTPAPVTPVAESEALAELSVASVAVAEKAEKPAVVPASVASEHDGANVGDSTVQLMTIKTAIRELAADLLKLREMDEHEAFQNYGMDSVFGVQLAIRLEKRLDLDIPPKWLIDFPTIQTLAEHLLAEQTSAITT